MGLKRVLAAFLICVGLLCASASAGVLARFTREGQGGVPGMRTSIRLPIGWCPELEECDSEPHELFEFLALSQGNIGRTVSVDETVDGDFFPLALGLTNGQADYLRFRTGLIKPPIAVIAGASSEMLEFEAFFPTHPFFVDFSESVVEEIRLTLDALTLTSPGTDPNEDGSWTDYSFRVTYTVVGYPLPEADCFQDGRTTLADWRHIRTTGSAPNRCLRGPQVLLPLGCSCSNTDAQLNDFDMDLLDFANFQNAFSEPDPD